MSKIHPTGSKCYGGQQQAGESSSPIVWTVWKKSSMAFHGSDGFSVFDCDGRLAFRVDNYSRKSKYLAGDIVLMDGDGHSLLTLRPKILSMHDEWNGFASEVGARSKSRSHIFSVRKTLFQSNSEVEVFMCKAIKKTSLRDFWCSGCFSRRCCKICSSTGEVAAVITRKKVGNSVTLGDDVFSLMVSPGFDSELMVALVIVMDRMCHKPFTPFLLCS